MKKWNYIFTIICISIMLLFDMLFIAGISPQTNLIGAVVQSEKPKVEIKNILSGKYQEEYGNWFSDHFPFRSYLVKAYDQIMFMSGNEVNGIISGKDGNLFGEYFTKQSLVGTLDETEIDKYSNNLDSIQENLEKRGKVLIYLITPSKAEIYPEDLPWNYLAALNSLDESGKVRGTLIKSFNKRNIRYIDYTELMLNLKKNAEYPLFYKTGIHWSQYASSQAVLEMTRYINENSNMNLPEIALSYRKIENAEFDEQDYLNLLNLYYSNYKESYYTADIALKDKSELENAFSMSTSFSFSLVNLYQKSDMPFNYYWRSQYTQYQDKLYRENNHVKWENWIPGVAVNDMNFEEIVNTSDIIIIENNACELPQSHIDFVRHLSEYLSQN